MGGAWSVYAVGLAGGVMGEDSVDEIGGLRGRFSHPSAQAYGDCWRFTESE